MQNAVRKISSLGGDMNLSPEFNVQFEFVLKKYNKLLSKFVGQSVVPILACVDLVKLSVIPKNSFCYYNTGFSALKFFISDGEIKNDRKNITALLIKDSRLTPEYLSWYFSKEPIKKLFELYSYGTILYHINPSVFDFLKLPIPKRSSKLKQAPHDIELKVEGSIKALTRKYYKEYLDNLTRKNYMAAAILAGAICESILYSYLLENDVDEEMLDGKTYGNLIEFVKITKPDNDFPINHFEDIKQLRNKVVHTSRAKKDIEAQSEIEIWQFNAFDSIIKYFGI